MNSQGKYSSAMKSNRLIHREIMAENVQSAQSVVVFENANQLTIPVIFMLFPSVFFTFSGEKALIRLNLGLNTR